MTGRLDVRSEVQLAAWTTIPTTGPGSVRNTAPISITTGRPNESSTITPSQATLTLDNRDNRWVVRNPTGAYYPNLVQNTPLRISLPASAGGLSNYLRFEGDRTSSATTPDKAGLQITGPIDVRVDCWPSDYSGNVLAAKWGATAKSWAFLLNATASPAFVNIRDIVTPGTGTLGFYWWDGTNQQMLDSGMPIPYFGQRICLRVLFTPSTGTAQFYTAPTMAGPFTQLGINQVFGATTLSAGVGQAVQIGGQVTLNIPPGQYAHTFGSVLGMVYEAQIYNNVTLEVDPVFSAQTAGTTSFTDSQSSVWTLNRMTESAGAAYVSNSAGLAASITSGSFTPAAGALLVAVASVGNGAGGAVTGTTMTDSVGGTWKPLITDILSGSGGADVWVKDAGPNPVAQTVTYGLVGPTADGLNLIVRQFTGAAPAASQTGATAHAHTSAYGISITPVQTGSQVVMGFGRTATAVTVTPNAATTLYGQVNGSASSTAALAEASALSSAGVPVTVGFTNTPANVNVIVAAEILAAGTAEISDRLYRFHGELSSLPRAADPSQHDINSPATATGITQRLQNSNTPLQSPMRRAYARLPASLHLAAYWPGEEGANATNIGSAVGGPPMQITGTPNLGSNSDFKCSAPLAGMNGATFTGNVPPGTTFTDNVVRFLYESPGGGETNGTVVASFTCNGGGVGYVTFVYSTGANFTMNAYNAPGGTLLGTCSTGSLLPNGGQARISLVLTKNGTGGTDMSMESLVPNGQAFANGTGAASISASPPGTVQRVQFLSGGVMGHWSVQGVWDTEYDTQGALCSWLGEPAATRIARLCSEEGIQCRIKGNPAASMAMWNQGIDTLTNLLQQCENTDLGMLYEPRECLGIGYRTRSSMYHQTPPCIVSFAGRQVSAGFAPATDTLLAVNDVTATSPTGSTARQVKTTGSMSTQAPPNGISRIDTQINPSPQTDAQLNQTAAWYLSVRSVDDDRYTAIPLNMARAETPVTAALLNIGDYLQITGTPAWVPPPPVRQLVAGYTETLGPQPAWLIGVNGIPELPYETAQAGAAAGTAGNAKADTAGSQLTASITNSATSFQVTTTIGPVWVQAALQFPFDIVIDREQMTVSAISSATSPQTFTISARSVNGVVAAHATGAAVSLYRKPIAAL